jgi:hypothetical protein
MPFAQRSDLTRCSSLFVEACEKKTESKLPEQVMVGAQHAAPLQEELRPNYFL